MAGNNAYLKKKAALEQGFLDVGEEMGIQKTWDYIQLALRDPEVMGKDTFGRKRMEKLYKKLVELVGHYHIAFTDDVEADHRQEELDNNLREIWGDDLKTFYERYPHLKRMDYRKKEKGVGMMDVTKTPYAGFLEMLIKTILELKPEQIAVVAVTKDGTALTSVYGDVGPYDLATMGIHMQADAMLEIVKANAREIIEAAEEDEEDE